MENFYFQIVVSIIGLRFSTAEKLKGFIIKNTFNTSKINDLIFHFMIKDKLKVFRLTVLNREHCHLCLVGYLKLCASFLTKNRRE